MRKLILASLLFISIIVLQFGVLNAFAHPISAINIPVALALTMIYFETARDSWAWPLLFGVVWDALSPNGFGVFIMTFILSWLIIRTVFLRVVTNMTWYSYIAFSAFGVVVWYTIYSIVVLVWNQALAIPLSHLWEIVVPAAIATWVLALFLYSIFRIAMRSLMPTHI